MALFNTPSGDSWNGTIWARTATLSDNAYRVAKNYLQGLLKQANTSSDSWIHTSPGLTAVSQAYVALDAILNASGDAARREAWFNFQSSINTIIQGQQSELQYARSTPEYQFMQMLATGMSPDAARAALTGSQAGQGLSPDAPTVSAPDSGQMLLDSLGTAASMFSTATRTIDGLARLKMSADLTRENLRILEAESTMNGVAARDAKRSENARAFASAFMNTLDTLKDEGYNASSFNEWLDIIRQTADEHNGASSVFLRDYGNLTNDYFSRLYTNGLLNNVSDNDTYYHQRALGLELQKVNIGKLRKEIGLYSEQINSIAQDVFNKQLSNIRGLLDFDIYSSSFSDIKSYTVTKWNNMMQAITAEDEDGVRISLDNLLKDQENQRYILYLAALHNGASYKFWSELANSGDDEESELFRQVSLFDNEFFGKSLDNWCKAAEAESKTYDFTVGVGSYSFNKRNRTGVARALYKLLHGVDLSEDLEDSVITPGQPPVNTPTNDSFIPSKARNDSINNAVESKTPWIHDPYLNP